MPTPIALSFPFNVFLVVHLMHSQQELIEVVRGSIQVA